METTMVGRRTPGDGVILAAGAHERLRAPGVLAPQQFSNRLGASCSDDPRRAGRVGAAEPARGRPVAQQPQDPNAQIASPPRPLLATSKPS